MASGDLSARAAPEKPPSPFRWRQPRPRSTRLIRGATTLAGVRSHKPGPGSGVTAAVPEAGHCGSRGTPRTPRDTSRPPRRGGNAPRRCGPVTEEMPDRPLPRPSPPTGPGPWPGPTRKHPVRPRADGRRSASRVRRGLEASMPPRPGDSTSRPAGCRSGDAHRIRARPTLASGRTGRVAGRSTSDAGGTRKPGRCRRDADRPGLHSQRWADGHRRSVPLARPAASRSITQPGPARGPRGSAVGPIEGAAHHGVSSLAFLKKRGPASRFNVPCSVNKWLTH